MFRRRNSSGNLVDATTVRRVAPGGARVMVETIRRRNAAGGWETTYSNYVVPVATAPASAFGNYIQVEPAPALYYVVTAAPVEVEVSGGTGSYAFLWERVSGSTAISPQSPGSASTMFAGDVPKNDSLVAVFRCRVSDGVSVVYSNNVTVTLTYSSGL